MKKLILCLGIALLLHVAVNAQKGDDSFIKVGELSPAIELTDVQYFPTNRLNIKDLRGKWVILDFWNFFCTSCVKEFPKLDSIQRRFEKEMKVILVGYTGTQYGTNDDKRIQQLYEKVRNREQLSLSIAYDSAVFHALSVYTPLKVIIDPKGIVRGITDRITSADMKAFLDGQVPKLPRAWLKNENKVTYDPELPLLIGGNGGNDTDFLYRSVLSEYKDYMRSDNESVYKIIGNKLQVIGTDLVSLYKFAYAGTGYISYGDSLYGKFSNDPIVEVRNSKPFEVDRDLRAGMYAYSIVFPLSKNSKESVMKMVRRDLQNYFGYKVNLEERMMPVWNLIAASKVKNLSKLPKDTPHNPFESIEYMLMSIAGVHNKLGVFVNATDLNDKIDITLNCDTRNFEEVKRALRENGFDLVSGEKKIQVVVIKDNPDENN